MLFFNSILNKFLCQRDKFVRMNKWRQQTKISSWFPPIKFIQLILELKSFVMSQYMCLIIGIVLQCWLLYLCSKNEWNGMLGNDKSTNGRWIGVCWGVFDVEIVCMSYYVHILFVLLWFRDITTCNNVSCSKRYITVVFQYFFCIFSSKRRLASEHH